MGEDYTNLSKEELIEKLKSKDEKITEMSKKYDCLKAECTKEIEEVQAMRTEAFAKLKQENEELKKSYYNSELSGVKAENELLKNTIVAMATYAYPSISDFGKILRNIEHNLEMIRKGK